MAEYFAARIEPDLNGGCWLWSAGQTTGGYGCAGLSHLPRKAHRASWVHHVGPIPRGMQVLHKCDVRVCVNPGHLFLGTHADNMADMARKGRGKNPRLRTSPLVCINGHAIDPSRERFDSRGRRYCVACSNARSAAWKRKTARAVAPRVTEGGVR